MYYQHGTVHAKWSDHRKFEDGRGTGLNRSQIMPYLGSECSWYHLLTLCKCKGHSKCPPALHHPACPSSFALIDYSVLACSHSSSHRRLFVMSYHGLFCLPLTLLWCFSNHRHGLAASFWHFVCPTYHHIWLSNSLQSLLNIFIFHMDLMYSHSPLENKNGGDTAGCWVHQQHLWQHLAITNARQ